MDGDLAVRQLKQLRLAYNHLREDQKAATPIVCEILDSCCTALCLADAIFVRVLDVDDYVARAAALLKAISACPSPSSRMMTLCLRVLALVGTNIPRGGIVLSNSRYGVVKYLAKSLSDPTRLLDDPEQTEEILKLVQAIAPHAHRAMVTAGIPSMLFALEPVLAEDKNLRVRCLGAILNIFCIATPDQWKDLAATVMTAVHSFDDSACAMFPSCAAMVKGYSRGPSSERVLNENDTDIIFSYISILSSICDRLLPSEPMLENFDQALGRLLQGLLVVLLGSVSRKGELGDKLRSAAMTPLMSIYYTSPGFALTHFMAHRVFHFTSTTMLDLLDRGQVMLRRANKNNTYTATQDSDSDSTEESDDVSPDNPNSTNIVHQLLSENINRIPLVADEMSVMPLLEFLLAILPVAPFGHSHDDYLTLMLPFHGWTWEDDFHNTTEVTERMSRLVEQYYSLYRRNPTKKNALRELTILEGCTLGVNLATQQFVTNSSMFPHSFRRSPLMEGFVHCRQNGLWNQRCTCIDGGHPSRSNILASTSCRSEHPEDITMEYSISRNGDVAEPSVSTVVESLHLHSTQDHVGTRNANAVNVTPVLPPTSSIGVGDTGVERADQPEFSGLPFDPTQPIDNSPCVHQERITRSMFHQMPNVRSVLGDETDQHCIINRELFYDGELWSTLLDFRGGTVERTNMLENNHCRPPTSTASLTVSGIFCCWKDSTAVVRDGRGGPLGRATTTSTSIFPLQSRVPKRLFQDDREVVLSSPSTRCAFLKSHVVVMTLTQTIPAIVTVINHSITPLVARNCSSLLLRCLSLVVLYCTDGDIANFCAGGGKFSHRVKVRHMIELLNQVIPSVVQVLYFLFVANHGVEGNGLEGMVSTYYPFTAYQGDKKFINAFERLGLTEYHFCYSLTVISEMRVAAADALILLIRLRRLTEHRFGEGKGLFPLFNKQQRAMLRDVAARRASAAEVQLHSLEKQRQMGTVSGDCSFHLSCVAAVHVYQQVIERLGIELSSDGDMGSLLTASQVDVPSLKFPNECGGMRSNPLKTMVSSRIVLMPNPTTSNTDGQPNGPPLTFEASVRKAVRSGATRYLQSPDPVRPLLALFDYVRANKIDSRYLVLEAEGLLRDLAQDLLNWCSSRRWYQANQEFLGSLDGPLEKLCGTTRDALTQRLRSSDHAKLLNLLLDLSGVVVNEVGLAIAEMPSRVATTLPCCYWRYTQKSRIAAAVDFCARTPLMVQFVPYEEDCSGLARSSDVHSPPPKLISDGEVTIGGRNYRYWPLIVDESCQVMIPPSMTVRSLRNALGNFIQHGRQRDLLREDHPDYIPVPLNGARLNRVATDSTTVSIRFPRGKDFASPTDDIKLTTERRFRRRMEDQSGGGPLPVPSRGDLVLQSSCGETPLQRYGFSNFDVKGGDSREKSASIESKLLEGTVLVRHVVFLVDGVVLSNPNMTITHALFEYGKTGESLREYEGCDVRGNQLDPKKAPNPSELRTLPFFRLCHRLQIIVLQEYASSIDHYNICGCCWGVPTPHTAQTESLCSPIHAFTRVCHKQNEPCDGALTLLSALTMTLQDERVEIPYANGDHRRLSSALLHDVVTQLSAFKYPPLAYTVLGEALYTGADVRGHLASYALWNYPNIFPFDLRVTVMRLLVASRSRTPRSDANIIHERPPGNESIFGFSWFNARSSYSIEVRRSKVLRLGSGILRQFAFYAEPIEVHFAGEPGIGLGPTLEFYELMGDALVDPHLNLWRTEEYTTATGKVKRRVCMPLYPSACVFSDSQYHFETLGLLLGRLLRLGRTTQLCFHPLFLSALRGEPLFCIPKVNSMNMALLDIAMERSLQCLEEMSEEELAGCELTFVLPVTEPIPPGADPTRLELCPNGSNTVVTTRNVVQYTQAVRAYYLQRLIQHVLTPLRCGLEGSLGPMHLRLFSAQELALLLNGSPGKLWNDAASFAKIVVAAHGYTMKSSVVRHLLQLIPSFSAEDQRSFLRFVTGSSTLPTSGLPVPLTVVRRDIADLPARVASSAIEEQEAIEISESLSRLIESSDSPSLRTGTMTAISVIQLGQEMATLATDRALPTVSTCFHYLKLPHYSSAEILKERLRYAMHEAAGSFELS